MEASINHQIILPLICISFCFLVEINVGQLIPIVDELGNNTSTSARIYIVHVQRPQGVGHLSRKQLRAWHRTFLPNRTLDSGQPRLLYSYRDAICGFAAWLTPQEVRDMKVRDGFVLAKPDKLYPLATTYTPQFMGLNQFDGAWYDSTYQGQGIVIGVLDGGIINDHPSFSDDGMPSKPTHWNGSCLQSSQIKCNRKIIGAAGFFGNQMIPAIDINGHGTHVAGIAAGNFVPDANVLGMARGTASGTAPRAHLAIYKVCVPAGCAGHSILAAIEKSINDKVDIISLSIGKGSVEFDDDPVVLGSMGAYLNRISPVVCAGNDGPGESTVAHEAPWVLTVGATSTDRRIRSTIILGNGKEYHGESAFQPTSFNSSIMLPIVYPGEFGGDSGCCVNGSLAQFDVKDKIVLCSECGVEEVEKGQEVYNNGGSAMIVMNVPDSGYTTASVANWIPASHLTHKDSEEILDYYFFAKSSAGSATATIKFGDTIFGHRPAPALASFSSRGPATINGGILKPDVLAPGVNILAASHEEVGPNPTGTLKKFDFRTGTSMAAPHVAGIVALIKSKYSNWSPSAIQSAIITSANKMDLDGHAIFDEAFNGKPSSIFSVGAGQVNASKALDPGLIFNVTNDDYVKYICGLGRYSDDQVGIIFKKELNCSNVQKFQPYNLNYPSITLHLKANSQPVIVQRIVTNVGDAMSTYRARITEPFGLRIDLSTYDLTFTRKDQKISFSITFTITSGPNKSPVSDGRLEWISSKHVVTSPIAIKWI